MAIAKSITVHALYNAMSLQAVLHLVAVVYQLVTSNSYLSFSVSFKRLLVFLWSLLQYFLISLKLSSHQAICWNLLVGQTC